MTDDEVIGKVGRTIVRIRGADAPGEVMVSVRGGTECFIAYSEQEIERSAEVLPWSDIGELTG